MLEPAASDFPPQLVLPADGPRRCALGLGANLGDAEATLRAAVTFLADRLPSAALSVSSLYRTAAVGGPAQPDYLNAVLVTHTGRSARDLLLLAREVEQEHGRERRVRWGPRTLDVDVLAVGGLVSTFPELLLPHPRAAERAFVLVPWAEADPTAALPGLGGVLALRDELDPVAVAGIHIVAGPGWWR